MNKKDNRPVLVTGAAGYIGSHMCRVLAHEGYEPIGLDNLSTGFEQAIMPAMEFYKGAAGDQALVARIIKDHGIKDVIHFAGSVVNAESIEQPAFYYENNTFETLRLVEACGDAGVKRFLYSSSAGVYGDHGDVILQEDMACKPLTPYGASKYMSERMIADIAAVKGFSHVCLRYFNVVGADIDRGIGQRSKVSTHILKIICEALVGKRDKISIFGTDYDTRDGTCIRDYVHVLDLAYAHRAALEYLAGGGESTSMNCGYGHGYSVREIIDTAFEVAGADVPVIEAERRPGDPSILVASNEKMKSLTGWSPERDDLKTIIESALEWERQLNSKQNAA